MSDKLNINNEMRQFDLKRRDFYDSLTDEGSPLYEAIKEAVDSVMASQEEATEEATGIKVEPVS